MEKLRKQDVGFTQVKNSILNSEHLSWKAKGLYAFLYSKPDGWQFSVDRIAKQGATGKDAVASGITELESCGLLMRKRMKSGRVTYVISHSKPLLDFPTVGFSHCGKTRVISNTVPDSNTDTDRENAKSAILPFVLRDEIGKLKTSPQRHIQLIGEYLEEVGFHCESHAAFKQTLQRHMRDARSLSDFTDAQIGKASEYATKEYKKVGWNIGTLIKIITSNLYAK